MFLFLSLSGGSSVADRRFVIIMASRRRHAHLATILMIICLDISTVVVAVVSAVTWDPKAFRYDNYNLDKGPVFYEAYYDLSDGHREKQYLDRRTVLERSFQTPSQDHFTHSADMAEESISNKESFVVADDQENPSKEQIQFQRNYETVDKFVSFPDQGLTIFDKNPRSTNIEEISKLVKKAIFRDLENWKILQRYLDRTTDQVVPQLNVYSRESRKTKENDGYLLPTSRHYKPLKKPTSKLLRKLNARDVKRRPIYVKKIDIKGNTGMNKINNPNVQVAITSTDLASDPVPMENIFQSRPQLIKYTFFKNPMTKSNEQSREEAGGFASRNHDNDLIRQKIVENHGARVEENVKVTSIEVSELPRHKTRHHHGEWSKRDYSSHRHRPLGNPAIS